MIEEFIPAGYHNRVSRPYLQSILHIPDREIRRQIEEAAERGILIVSADGGYFQRKDKNDDPYIEGYYAQERKRFTTQSKKLKRLRRAMEGIDPDKHDKDQVPGQMSFEW